MKKEELLERVNYLIGLGEAALQTKYGTAVIYVSAGLSAGFRSASLSFLFNLLGKNHVYYKEFDKGVSQNLYSNTSKGIFILKSFKDELDRGWVTSYKSLVTADIFSDFLEMSKYLLDEKFKDAAAVMIGSVLEEHLRHLCINNTIEITFIKDGGSIPKKASLLNDELKKAEVYGPIDQKSISFWLGLRNSAAHGKYTDYTIEQVNVMYMGVLDFITRTT